MLRTTDETDHIGGDRIVKTQPLARSNERVHSSHTPFMQTLAAKMWGCGNRRRCKPVVSSADVVRDLLE